MQQPTLYIPHGGGPCFFMDWTFGPADTWDKMADWLGSLGNTLANTPRAIVVISAHWETAEFSVTTNPQPELIFDYYGFPAHTYQLQYPVLGDPGLAAQVADLLESSGISCRQDPERGFDHGVFVPFKLIYPDANIPIVQLSVKSDLDPQAHIAAGKALKSLRSENILIVGSGFSSHNLAAMMKADTELEGSVEFDQWLTETSMASESNREAVLADWLSAPYARQIHPREEHLIPLMVVAGAAGPDSGRKIFSDHLMGTVTSAIQFG